MIPGKVTKHLPKSVGVKYLNKKWEEQASPNKMKAYMVNGGNHSSQRISGPNLKAADRSTRLVEPDITREGGSIPITSTLETTTDKPCVSCLLAVAMTAFTHKLRRSIFATRPKGLNC